MRPHNNRRHKRSNSIASDQSPRQHTLDWNLPSTRRVNSALDAPSPKSEIIHVTDPARRHGFRRQSNEIMKETVMMIRGPEMRREMDSAQVAEEYRLFMSGASPFRDHEKVFTSARNDTVLLSNTTPQPLTRRNSGRPASRYDANVFNLLDSDEEDPGAEGNAAEGNGSTIDRQNTIIGPCVPFVANVSLKDLGTSPVLPQEWYVLWRVITLLLGLAAGFITAWTSTGAPHFSAAYAVMWLSFSFVLSFCRIVQYQLVTTSETLSSNTDIITCLRPYSW